MLCARMHLRGPWEYELRAGPEAQVSECDLAPTGKVTMPASWQSLFGEYRGGIRFRRRFHRPSNLDADERVWLVVQQVRAEGTLMINGHSLGEFDPAQPVQRFDLTPHLLPDSVLQFDLNWTGDASAAEPVGLHQLVALEIHRDD